MQKLLGEWFFKAALLSKLKRAAMCEMCRWKVVGVNKSSKSRMLGPTEKMYVNFFVQVGLIFDMSKVGHTE